MGKKLRLALALVSTALLAYTLYSTIVGRFELVLAAPGCIASLTLQRKYPYLAALLTLLSYAFALAVVLQPHLGVLVQPIAPLPVNATR